MNRHRDTITVGVFEILNLLLAHKAMGRDLDDIIRYLQRTYARRQREEEEE